MSKESLLLLPSPECISILPGLKQQELSLWLVRPSLLSFLCSLMSTQEAGETDWGSNPGATQSFIYLSSLRQSLSLAWNLLSRLGYPASDPPGIPLSLSPQHGECKHAPHVGLWGLMFAWQTYH